MYLIGCYKFTFLWVKQTFLRNELKFQLSNLKSLRNNMWAWLIKGAYFKAKRFWTPMFLFLTEQHYLLNTKDVKNSSMENPGAKYSIHWKVFKTSLNPLKFVEVSTVLNLKSSKVKFSLWRFQWFSLIKKTVFMCILYWFALFILLHGVPSVAWRNT